MADTALDIITPISIPIRRVLATDTHDDVAAKLEACEALRQWAKVVCGEIEAGAMEWIKENKPVRVGQTLYWVGTVKKPPKCIHIETAVEKLLDACGGDFERFCRHLAAQPIKYGAAKATLAQDVYESLFVVEEVEELQSDDAAKAAKKLMKAPVNLIGKN